MIRYQQLAVALMETHALLNPPSSALPQIPQAITSLNYILFPAARNGNADRMNLRDDDNVLEFAFPSATHRQLQVLQVGLLHFMGLRHGHYVQGEAVREVYLDASTAS